jgi:hypothetical protein
LSKRPSFQLKWQESRPLDIYDLFNFPLSMIAQEEWNELYEELLDINFNHRKDEWTFL